MNSKLKRSSLIAIVVSAFLVGLWIGHSSLRLPASLVLALVALALIACRTRLLVPTIILAGLALGAWRGYKSNSTYLALTSRFDQKVTLIGQVTDDPALSDKGYVIFNIGHLSLDDQPTPGLVRITSPYTKLQRGYQVSVTAKLKPALGSQTAELFAKPTILSTRQNWLEHLRQRFFAGIRTALPEPLAALGLGLLVGTRTLLPKTLQDQLTLVGLSHLVAVSGYNLTILVNAAYKPLRRISKYLATVTALWLILGFLVVSGFSASIIRAAIVATLVLLSSYYGAQAKPLTLIAIAAGLTAFWRPEYLWSDLGWQLSFLAFFGIMVMAPAIQSRFIKRPHWLKSLLIESTAAQVTTFPLIVLIFGRLSLISPATNFLILPLVPAAMLLSFIAGLAGVLVPALSGWLAWPAALVLRLMLSIIDWFAKVRWASLDLTASNTEILGFYLIIACTLALIMRAAKKSQTSTPSEAQSLNLTQTSIET